MESYSSSSLTDACFGLLGLWKKPAPPAAAAPATIPSPSRAELDQRDSTEKSPALANFLSPGDPAGNRSNGMTTKAISVPSWLSLKGKGVYLLRKNWMKNKV